jgi:hypothetical protein
MRYSVELHGRHRVRPDSGGALIRLAALSHAVTRPEVQDQLYLVGRGETPMARASSAARRRDMADPEKRKIILDRLAAGRRTAEARANWEKSHPRRRGRWLPKRKPNSQRTKNRRTWRRNVGTASGARFKNPEFRARALQQLAAAREVLKAKRMAGRTA